MFLRHSFNQFVEQFPVQFLSPFALGAIGFKDIFELKMSLFTFAHHYPTCECLVFEAPHCTVHCTPGQVRDTRDHLGRGRFNGYSFRKLLFPGAVSLFERYWKDSLYFSPDGPSCCSSKAVTFQVLH